MSSSLGHKAASTAVTPPKASPEALHAAKGLASLAAQGLGSRHSIHPQSGTILSPSLCTNAYSRRSHIVSAGQISNIPQTFRSPVTVMYQGRPAVNPSIGSISPVYSQRPHIAHLGIPLTPMALQVHGSKYATSPTNSTTTTPSSTHGYGRAMAAHGYPIASAGLHSGGNVPESPRTPQASTMRSDTPLAHNGYYVMLPTQKPGLHSNASVASVGSVLAPASTSMQTPQVLRKSKSASNLKVVTSLSVKPVKKKQLVNKASEGKRTSRKPTAKRKLTKRKLPKEKAEKSKGPGYGSLRPNPNVGKICSRGFRDCGATPGNYDPITRRMLGRKHHSVACNHAWKTSGAISLVGSDAHRRKRGRHYDGRARGEKAVKGAERAAAAAAKREKEKQKRKNELRRGVDALLDFYS